MKYVVHIYSLPLTKGFSTQETQIEKAGIFKKNEKFRKELVKKIGHPVKIFGPHRWNPYYHVPTEFVNRAEAEALADIIRAEVNGAFDDGRLEPVWPDPNFKNPDQICVFERNY